MVIATHTVKIRGTFDRNIWDAKKLRKYVRKKIICDIQYSFHTHLELFKADIMGGEEKDKGKIEVCVYVHGLPSEITKDVIKKWIDINIKEDGLTIGEFEYEMIIDLTKYSEDELEIGRCASKLIDIPWLSFNDMNDEEREWCLDKSRKFWDRQSEIGYDYLVKKEKRRKDEGISHAYIKG